jgi:hypothetical protein
MRRKNMNFLSQQVEAARDVNKEETLLIRGVFRCEEDPLKKSFAFCFELYDNVSVEQFAEGLRSAADNLEFAAKMRRN